MRLHWNAEGLQAQLQPLLPGLGVQVQAECDSTNSHLLERAREANEAGDHFAPCLLVAEQQTRGRGRLGRGWVSAAGASLTFSLALPLAPRDWSGLSLAVGLALAEALDPAHTATAQSAGGPQAAATCSFCIRPGIGLKWPNDLWLVGTGPESGRKLGGVLIETVNLGSARICIVGVGLNVHPLAPEVARGLSLACLHELDAAASAPRALAQAATPLVQALRRFEREGFAPLQARYAERDILRGHEVVTSQGQTGVAEGVDAGGALVLCRAGERQRIVSGEVSVRRAAAPERIA